MVVPKPASECVADAAATGQVKGYYPSGGLGLIVIILIILILLDRRAAV
jgi:hypothetical protein